MYRRVYTFDKYDVMSMQPESKVVHERCRDAPTTLSWPINKETVSIFLVYRAGAGGYQIVDCLYDFS